MDTTAKLYPGQMLNPFTFRRLDGEDYIRGQHCPICKSYLGEIEQRRGAVAASGVSVPSLSADSEAQTHVTAEAARLEFPLLYGMDEVIMQRLRLYGSEPRLVQETDHRFPEPALFVVNANGMLQLVDIANAPFLRPDLDRLVGGLGFIIEKNYPIRGTYR